MTNVSLPIAGRQKYEHARVVLRHTETAPWTGPRSLLLWDSLIAAVVALAASATLLTERALVLSAALPLGWCIALKLSRATEPVLVGTLGQGGRRVVRAGWTLALAGCAVSTVPGSTFTSGEAFIVALVCAVGSLAVRVAVWCAVGLRGVRGRPRVLVIGAPDERENAVAALERRAGPALSVVPVRIDSGSDLPVESPGVTSVPLHDVASYAGRIGACSVVVMPGSGLEPAGLRRLQWLLEESRLPLYVGTGLIGVASARLDATDVDGLPLVRVHAVQRGGARSIFIDAAGRCVAAVALLLVLPWLVLIGGAIRRESPGPAVFRQQRVGQDGRLFTLYKLRTMGVAPQAETELANDLDGVLFKMRSDPRVTPLGGWLRKYSLDELPQLLNVLLGQMRLVGPRPALPEEVAAYSEDMRRRLAVRPGITGLWQVSGRSDLTWEETVRLDLHYVDNWAPALDLVILCRTFRAVLGHRGAY